MSRRGWSVSYYKGQEIGHGMVDVCSVRYGGHIGYIDDATATRCVAEIILHGAYIVLWCRNHKTSPGAKFLARAIFRYLSTFVSTFSCALVKKIC